MAFYYDGINPYELIELLDTGVISGVTTNLTLVNGKRKDEGISRIEALEPIMKVCQDHNLKISLQVDTNTHKEILEEAISLFELYKGSNRIMIKIPVNFENLKAISACSHHGIEVNATCITSFMQAKLATLAGAKIVSFFWGKMSDQGIDPYLLIEQYFNWRSREGLADTTKILVGSVRQPASIHSAYVAGADIVTTSRDNIAKLANQLMSDEANRLFQETVLQN